MRVAGLLSYYLPTLFIFGKSVTIYCPGWANASLDLVSDPQHSLPRVTIKIFALYLHACTACENYPLSTYKCLHNEPVHVGVLLDMRVFQPCRAYTYAYGGYFTGFILHSVECDLLLSFHRVLLKKMYPR
ncbi:hypothetical protein BZA77DRAFT_292831 [Pyronema omphalodes]|nr:hypothetical protein BZA77DRAFT_292831 [Pyronema omphalodes]